MNEDNLRKGYTAYELGANSHSQLLAHVAPVHPETVAHHVTHEFGVYEQLPPDARTVRVVAAAQNEKVQAVVVKVNGSYNRPDGSIYHITVSVDRSAGGKPVDSNDLLADRSQWTDLDEFDLAVTPKFIPR